MSSLNDTTPLAVVSKQINGADTTWVLFSTVLVFIMIPGVGYFYGGTSAHSKNKLSLFFSSFIAIAIVSIQWFLWGYSLVFSPNGSKFIGSYGTDTAYLVYLVLSILIILDRFLLRNVGNEPSDLAPTIPENAFMLYQCMFACITAALAFGSAAERSPLRVYIIFVFFWSLAVYNFVAYWVWGPHGWLKEMGALDFAGGTPVHVVSAFSALAYAIAAGKRKGFAEKELHPNNISDVFIGTVLIWFGWFGFNGGSELAADSRAVNALVVTNLTACISGIFWVIMDMILKRSPKISLFGFCSGAIAGLVTITPAAGYVTPASSFVFGVSAGVLCCLSCKIKTLTRYKFDDACDVFAVHGVGGIIGSLLTGIFADNSVAVMSGGAPIPGGWLNNNFIQLGYQLAGVVAGAAWSFVISFALLKLINLIPFCKVKTDEKSETIGLDWAELGENASSSRL